MKVLVIGSTGVLGRNVVPRLVENGHEVRALVRRQEQAETYQRMGIETTRGDILEPESLMMAAKGCDAALHLATAFAKMDWNMTDRIRREGTKNLLQACTENHVTKYIQQSIIYLRRP
ncbi:MAG: NAD(P)H-binding protein [Bacteroidetes bacterium]|nr:NAD(P)H-binding protein [Bacteroidota bacterium]